MPSGKRGGRANVSRATTFRVSACRAGLGAGRTIRSASGSWRLGADASYVSQRAPGQ